MSAVAASAVTFNDSWNEGGIVSKRVVAKDVTIVLSSQGGLTNYISAAILGLATIESGGVWVDSAASKAYLTAPSYDRSKLCVYDITNATDASRATPADVTVTLRGVVKGQPA